MMAYGKPEIDPTDITFTLKHILVSLTATSAQMLIGMIPNMIPAPVSLYQPVQKLWYVTAVLEIPKEIVKTFYVLFTTNMPGFVFV